MKKILITFPELYYGGAEKQFRELVSRIDKNKFKIVVVVSCVHLGNNQPKTTEEYVKANPEVMFYFLKDLNISKNIRSKISVANSYRKQLKRIVEIEKPDIALFYSGMELCGSHLLRKNGAKVIFSEREDGDRGTLKLFRYKLFFLNVNKIVCNSKQAQRYYKKHSISSDYFPNGIAVNEILKSTDHEFCILMPARIARVKNQELVINALARLKDITFKTIFIGKQEDKNYLSYLRSLAKEKRVDNKIEFLEFTTDISSYYQESDVVILPSQMEGFTNVLLESYMYGRLCIVSDIIMNKDVASPSQRFCNVYDDALLASLIKEVYDMGEVEKNKEINENHQYVLKHFSLEAMVDNYSRLFDTL